MSDPVVLIAVDGLDWKLVRAGIEARRLPTLARLMGEGAHAEVAVRSCVPGLMGAEEGLNSPTLWTTVATGQYYFQHGVYDFSNLLHSVEKPPLFESEHVLTPRFWDVLSCYGRSSLVVGFYVTYPAYPLRGVMVSDLFGEVAARNVAWPPEQCDSLAQVLGAANYEALAASWFRACPAGAGHSGNEPTAIDVQSAAEDWNRVLRRFTRLTDKEIATLTSLPASAPLRKLVEYRLIYPVLRDERYHRIFIHLLDQQAWDLAIVYYRLVDFVSHGFWLRRDAVSADFARAYGGIVDEAYRWIDERVAEVRASVPESARLLVLSDHGFVANDRVVELGNWQHVSEFSYGCHAEPAVLLAAGGPARGPIDGVTLLDIAPTIFDYFGLPQARSLDGGPIPGLLHPECPQSRPPVDTYPYTRPSATGRIEAHEQQQILERLAALGYLEA